MLLRFDIRQRFSNAPQFNFIFLKFALHLSICEMRLLRGTAGNNTKLGTQKYASAMFSWALAAPIPPSLVSKLWLTHKPIVLCAGILYIYIYSTTSIRSNSFLLISVPHFILLQSFIFLMLLAASFIQGPEWSWMMKNSFNFYKFSQLWAEEVLGSITSETWNRKVPLIRFQESHASFPRHKTWFIFLL
jgi:hypothetical protein